MKLIEIRVEDFRNFIDSSPINIQPDITCLVGKNESGKTAIMHALYRLLPARANVKFSLPDNYPAWLEKQHRLQGVKLEEVKPISVVFNLEEKDKKVISDQYGFYFLSDDTITLSKDYSGTLHYSVLVDEKKFINHFLSNMTIPEQY